jgi:hypothetical protein
MLTCSLPAPAKADPVAPSADQDTPVRPPTRKLPPERRRPISSRLDDILADPRASTCREDCPTCSGLKPATAKAALLVWDDLARSDAWPIRTSAVLHVLRSNNITAEEGAGHKRISRLLAHRRGEVLYDLVQKEIKRWGVVSGAETASESVDEGSSA